MGRPHGQAEVDPAHPRAFAVDDRTGAWTNLHKLRWQYEYAGTTLINKRILTQEQNLDVPQPQLRTLILPPDPKPVFNARTEPFSLDEH